MFSKDKDSNTTPAPASRTGERRRGNCPPSLISPDLCVSGNLGSPGDLQVDGTVEGDIQCHALTIGASANTIGQITAEEVLVRGTHTGNIDAKAVTLAKSARINGDIRHDTLAVESGAVLNGHLINRQNTTTAPAIAGTKPTLQTEADHVQLVRQQPK